MLRTIDEKIDPQHAALIVIDMQNDFCHENRAGAPAGGSIPRVQGIVPQLQTLINGAHEAGTPVIFTQAIHNEWTDSEVRQERRIDRDPICVEGTWGAEFYGVIPEERDMVLPKNRFSAFIGANLDLVLRTKGIKTLILTGTVTSICVESTARDATMMDYYVVVLDDCTSAGSQEVHERALQAIDGPFGVVTDSKEVLQAWAQR